MEGRGAGQGAAKLALQTSLPVGALSSKPAQTFFWGLDSGSSPMALQGLDLHKSLIRAYTSGLGWVSSSCSIWRKASGSNGQAFWEVENIFLIHQGIKK